VVAQLRLTLKINIVKDMKEEIEQIKEKLENSEISEKEALNLLLGLLSVNISFL
jgi:predicted nuclease with TOPRIM domain